MCLLHIYDDPSSDSQHPSKRARVFSWACNPNTRNLDREIPGAFWPAILANQLVSEDTGCLPLTSVCTYAMCACVEARGRHWVSWSITTSLPWSRVSLTLDLSEKPAGLSLLSHVPQLVCICIHMHRLCWSYGHVWLHMTFHMSLGI